MLPDVFALEVGDGVEILENLGDRQVVRFDLESEIARPLLALHLCQE